ncbi:hypothetical protein F5X96DRAFT_689302 [Biscogniauxia mediterranea]|nr:hypothetical protein F5X96DRAFT_689302 [Biscogniauxia mediterranea]
MSSSSSSSLQPIKLYGNWGINPSKVAIYYGQAGGRGWFKLFVRARARAAPDGRVSAVVDGHLAREEAGKKKKKEGEGEGDGPWFVDVAMSTTWTGRYPHLEAWLDKMLARETVRSTLEKFRP